MYEKYREAGRIAREALHRGIKSVKEGKSYLEVAEDVENYILERANLAFPVNISVNSVAAHYTPRVKDELVFEKGDVVKIDVGVHVDGYIADTAKTVEVGSCKWKRLIESAEQALEEAINVVRAGINVGEIGGKIQRKIEEYGYRPIKNLQGHSLGRYNLHAGLSIPNILTDCNEKLRKGDVIAIEPFATNGEGIVMDSGLGNIFRVVKTVPYTSEIKRRFDGLPFAGRWMYRIYGERTYAMLSLMMKRRLVFPYFRLIEKKRGMVAQAEHTLIVKEEGCEVIT